MIVLVHYAGSIPETGDYKVPERASVDQDFTGRAVVHPSDQVDGCTLTATCILDQQDIFHYATNTNHFHPR